MGTPLQHLVRGRGLRWAATVVLAVTAGAVAATTVQRAEQIRAAYGDTRRVPVAGADLAVGHALGDADLVWSDLPVALVPDGVASDPTGRTVTEPMVAGEVVVERRLSGGATEGLAALLAPGRRALALPVESAPPGLAVGDRVEAYVPSVDGGSLADLARAQGTGARRVARDAVVVAVDDRVVTVSVTASDASALAGSVLDGAVTLALVAPG